MIKKLKKYYYKDNNNDRDDFFLVDKLEVRGIHNIDYVLHSENMKLFYYVYFNYCGINLHTDVIYKYI